MAASSFSHVHHDRYLETTTDATCCSDTAHGDCHQGAHCNVSVWGTGSLHVVALHPVVDVHASDQVAAVPPWHHAPPLRPPRVS